MGIHGIRAKQMLDFALNVNLHIGIKRGKLMPNRIIKESILTSKNLNRLTPEEEIFFYRLIVNCDDYGRMDAHPSILRSKCFPLRTDDISIEQIIDWINSLIGNELIIVYTVNNNDYIQVITWEEHQRIRAKKSKFPDINGHKPHEIDSNSLTSDNNSQTNDRHSPTNVSVIQSNTIQYNNTNIYKRKLDSIVFAETEKHVLSSDMLLLCQKHSEEFSETINYDLLMKMAQEDAREIIAKK